MARKSMTDLKAEATTNLPDNTTGQISPADVRGSVIDFMDTMTPGYVAATIATPGSASVGATWEDLTVWDSLLIVTPEFSYVPGTGITTLNADCVIDFQINLTVELASNQTLEVRSVASSSPFNYTADVRGQGTNEPVNVSLSGLYDGTMADTFKIQAQAGTSVNFLNGAYLVRLVPLINNPTP